MGETGEQPEQWRALAPGVVVRPGARGVGPDPGRAGRPATGGQRAGARIRGRLGVGVALLVGMLVLVVAVSGTRATPPGIGMTAPVAPAPTPRSGPTGGTATGPPHAGTRHGVVDLGSVDWWSVLAELDRRRADALQHGDPSGLEGYAVPDSPAWRGDAALVASLSDAGAHPVGLGAAVLAIEDVIGCGSDACLVVVDQRSAYAIVDAQGGTVESVPAAAARRWRITLASMAPGEGIGPADPGWRVRQVEAIP